MSANAALTNNTGQSRAAASQITMPSGELSTTRRQASADQLFMCRVRRPASGPGRPRPFSRGLEPGTHGAGAPVQAHQAQDRCRLRLGIQVLEQLDDTRTVVTDW